MAQAQTRGTGRPGRELALLLAAGAIGAGIVLGATRQVLARVVVHPPRPLPASVLEVTGQDLRPALAALAVAALASLAAVLATRGMLRRITGVLTIVLGAGIGLAAAGRVTAAQALSAAKDVTAGLATGASSGTAAGSVTAGGAGGPDDSGLPLSGLPVHVTMLDTPWRAAMIGGALLIVGAGLAIVVRAGLLPAMSGRYDRPSTRTAGRTKPRMPARAGTGSSMWESLSAGDDPTVGLDHAVRTEELWPLRGPASSVRTADVCNTVQSSDLRAQSSVQGRRLPAKPPSVRSGAPGNPPEGTAKSR